MGFKSLFGVNNFCRNLNISKDALKIIGAHDIGFYSKSEKWLILLAL